MSNLNRVTIFTLLSTLALFSADTIAQRSRQVQKQTKQVENKKIEPKKVATNQGKNETLKKKLTKPKKQLSKKDSTIADTLTPNRLGIRPGSDTIGLTEGHLDSSAPETEKSNTQINQNDYADTTGLFVREQYIEKQMPLDSVSNALTNADFENLCNKINVSQEDRLPFIEGFYYQPLQLGNYLHSGSGHSQTRYSNESEDTRKNIDSYIAKQLKKNPQFETLVKKVAVDLVNFLKDDNRPEALNNIESLLGTVKIALVDGMANYVPTREQFLKTLYQNPTMQNHYVTLASEIHQIAQRKDSHEKAIALLEKKLAKAKEKSKPGIQIDLDGKIAAMEADEESIQENLKEFVAIRLGVMSIVKENAYK